MKAVRMSLVGIGVLACGWGAWLMLSQQDLDQLLSAGVWLIAVVVVHDGSVAALSAAGLGRRKALAAASAPSPSRDDLDEGAA